MVIITNSNEQNKKKELIFQQQASKENIMSRVCLDVRLHNHTGKYNKGGPFYTPGRFY